MTPILLTIGMLVLTVLAIASLWMTIKNLMAIHLKSATAYFTATMLIGAVVAYGWWTDGHVLWAAFVMGVMATLVAVFIFMMYLLGTSFSVLNTILHRRELKRTKASTKSTKTFAPPVPRP